MDGTNLHILLKSGNRFKLNLEEGVSEQIRLINPATNSFTGKISINTVEGWAQKSSYIPSKGEIAIFSDRNVVNGVEYPGIKIGDGKAYCVDLPFLGDDIIANILNIITDHVSDMSVHVSSADRTFWNNKLNYRIEDEALFLTNT